MIFIPNDPQAAQIMVGSFDDVLKRRDSESPRSRPITACDDKIKICYPEQHGNFDDIESLEFRDKSDHHSAVEQPYS